MTRLGMRRSEIRIPLEDEIDLGKIADSGQCFRAYGLPDGSFRFPSGSKCLNIRREGDSLIADCTEEEWADEWRDYFDFGCEYGSFRRALAESGGVFASSAEQGYGIRILRQQPFETLISFLLSQRKRIPAIRSSIEKLCRSFGEEKPTGMGDSFFTFPKPEQLAFAALEDLNRCGLGYRTPYVKQAAARVCLGEADLEAYSLLTDEELLNMLMRFYGAGIKVASCTALFAYGRQRCVPVDVWIRRFMAENGENCFEGYGDKAGIIQQYVFYAQIQS